MTERLQIHYRIDANALPPQPIRLKVPGWGGSPDIKMVNGSEPQPWHCLPFVEASAYGLELLYPYDAECHIVNDAGDIRIEWQPGGNPEPGAFGLFFPKPTKFYTFGSLLDLQAPPGYVLRTNPHPRFFTDDTGTVPMAIVGHVQTEWWAKKLFLVFKVPPPGSRHIFRKAEPYVQILFVPQTAAYDLELMSPEQAEQRKRVEEGVELAKAYASKNVWHNPSGVEFSDHYKVLARTRLREGPDAVAKAVQAAVDYHAAALPSGKTLPEYMQLAERYEREGKLIEAKEIYLQLRRLEPNHAELANRSGLLAAYLGLTETAIDELARAAELQPGSPDYRYNLGEALRRVGRYAEAEARFREALRLSPNNPQIMSNLGLTLAQQGRMPEAVEQCRAASQGGARIPVVVYRLGCVLAMLGRRDEAKNAFNSTLAMDPNFAPAKAALAELAELARPQ